MAALLPFASGQDASPTQAPLEGGFDSGNLLPNARWNHTFTTEGTFAYFCRPHPFMKGTVEVAADATDSGNATVRISGSAFRPDSIRVQPGTTVEWVNEDPLTHTITQTGASADGGRNTVIVLIVLGVLVLTGVAVVAARRRRRGPS